MANKMVAIAATGLCLVLCAGIGVLYTKATADHSNAPTCGTRASSSLCVTRPSELQHDATSPAIDCPTMPMTCAMWEKLLPLVREAAGKVFTGETAAACNSFVRGLQQLPGPLVDGLADAWASIAPQAPQILRNTFRRAAANEAMWASGDLHVVQLALFDILASEAQGAVLGALALPRVRGATQMAGEVVENLVDCHWRPTLARSIGNSTSEFWAAVREIVRALAASPMVPGAVLEANDYNEVVALLWNLMARGDYAPGMRPEVRRLMRVSALVAAQVAAEEPQDVIEGTRARHATLTTGMQRSLQSWVDDDIAWAEFAEEMADAFVALEEWVVSIDLVPRCTACQHPIAADESRDVVQRTVVFARALSAIASSMAAAANGFDLATRQQFCDEKERLQSALSDAFATFFAPELKVLSVDDKLRERVSYRQRVVDELSSTEEDYLADLRLVDSVWQPELKKAGLMQQSEMQVLFGNFGQLIFLSSELSGNLQRDRVKPESDQRVGELFNKMIPFLKVYIEYCLNQIKGAEILADALKNKQFRDWMEKTRHMNGALRSLDLGSFLIKPTQRVTKYPLFLKDLIAHTPEGHPDLKFLNEAMEAMKQVLLDINFRKKERETIMLLSKLFPDFSWKGNQIDLYASHCYLIKNGKAGVSVVSPIEVLEKGSFEIALFNSVILVYKRAKDHWHEVCHMPTAGMYLRDSPMPDTVHVCCTGREDSLVLSFAVVIEKQHWCIALKEAIAEAPQAAPLVMRLATPRDRVKDKSKKDKIRERVASPIPREKTPVDSGMASELGVANRLSHDGEHEAESSENNVDSPSLMSERSTSVEDLSELSSGKKKSVPMAVAGWVLRKGGKKDKQDEGSSLKFDSPSSESLKGSTIGAENSPVSPGKASGMEPEPLDGAPGRRSRSNSEASASSHSWEGSDSENEASHTKAHSRSSSHPEESVCEADAARGGMLHPDSADRTPGKRHSKRTKTPSISEFISTVIKDCRGRKSPSADEPKEQAQLSQEDTPASSGSRSSLTAHLSVHKPGDAQQQADQKSDTSPRDQQSTKSHSRPPSGSAEASEVKRTPSGRLLPRAPGAEASGQSPSPVPAAESPKPAADGTPHRTASVRQWPNHPPPEPPKSPRTDTLDAPKSPRTNTLDAPKSPRTNTLDASKSPRTSTLDAPKSPTPTPAPAPTRTPSPGGCTVPFATRHGDWDPVADASAQRSGGCPVAVTPRRGGRDPFSDACASCSNATGGGPARAPDEKVVAPWLGRGFQPSAIKKAGAAPIPVSPGRGAPPAGAAVEVPVARGAKAAAKAAEKARRQRRHEEDDELGLMEREPEMAETLGCLIHASNKMYRWGYKVMYSVMLVALFLAVPVVGLFVGALDVFVAVAARPVLRVMGTMLREVLSVSDHQKTVLDAIVFLGPKEHVACRHAELLCVALAALRRANCQPGSSVATLVVQYHRAKQLLSERLRLGTTAESVERLVKDLGDQDAERLCDTFDAALASRALTVPSCYEVLRYPELLDLPQVNVLLTRLLVHSDTDQLALALSEGWREVPRPAGLYVLLMHSDGAMRQLAEKVAKSFGPVASPEDYMSLAPVVAKCMEILQYEQFGSEADPDRPFTADKTIFWNGFTNLLQNHLSGELLEGRFVAENGSIVSIVLNHIEDEEKLFWPVLRCMDILFRRLRNNFWSKTDFPPVAILGTLSKRFANANPSDSQTLTTIVKLLTPFVMSLELWGESLGFFSCFREVATLMMDRIQQMGPAFGTLKSMARTFFYRLLFECEDALFDECMLKWAETLILDSYSRSGRSEALPMAAETNVLRAIQRSAALARANALEKQPLPAWVHTLWTKTPPPPTEKILIVALKSHAQVCVLPCAESSAISMHVAGVHAVLRAFLEKSKPPKTVYENPEIADAIFSFVIMPDCPLKRSFEALVTDPLRSMRKVASLAVATKHLDYFEGITYALDNLLAVDLFKSLDYASRLFLWANFAIQDVAPENKVTAVITVSTKLWAAFKLVINSMQASHKLDEQSRKLFEHVCQMILEVFTAVIQVIPSSLTDELEEVPISCAECQDDQVHDSTCTKCAHPVISHFVSPDWLYPFLEMGNVAVLRRRWMGCLIPLIRAFSVFQLGCPPLLEGRLRELLLEKDKLEDEVLMAIYEILRIDAPGNLGRGLLDNLPSVASPAPAAPLPAEAEKRVAPASAAAVRPVVTAAPEPAAPVKAAAPAAARVLEPAPDEPSYAHENYIESAFSLSIGDIVEEQKEQDKRDKQKEQEQMVVQASNAPAPDDSNEDVFTEMIHDQAEILRRIKMRAGPARKRVVQLTAPTPRSFFRREQARPAMTPYMIQGSLWKEVLPWDYNDIKGSRGSQELTAIPTSFVSVDEYRRVFKPLLLEELAEGLEQGKEDDHEQPFRAMRSNCERVGEFLVVSFQRGDESLPYEFFRENTLVVVSSTPRADQSDAVHAIGRVEQQRVGKERQWLTVLFSLTAKDRGRRLKDFDDRMKSGDALWYVKRIGTVVNTLREWTSLCTLDSLPLLSHLLSPFRHASPEASINRARTSSLRGFLPVLRSAGFNDSQIGAIEHATCGEGFRLVQGPPGTGKTRTIVGMLSALRYVAMDLLPQHARARVSETMSETLHYLVCAPSNAAVDEIVLRLLKLGLWEADGSKYKPIIVRIGSESTMIPDVKECSIESLTEKELAKSPGGNALTKIREKIEEHRRALRDVGKRKAELRAEMQPDGDNAAILEQLRVLDKRYQDHDAQLKILRSNEELKFNARNEEKKRAMAKVLNRADIVCTTLSSSAVECVNLLACGFQTVIVDEAAQSVELETLIPIRKDVQRAILIGDTKQLPATVLSHVATEYQFGQSLFRRLELCDNKPFMLTVQYRMHPEISKFPSLHFYDDKLENAECVRSKEYDVPFYQKGFSPFAFFDLPWSREMTVARSKKNQTEAEYVMHLIDSFWASDPANKEYSVGVITPYKQQVWEIQRLVGARKIEVNTIDGFQGREKDVIVFSCVRAPVGTGIGFLTDLRRMNVGITRAKHAMWLVGNSSLLAVNEDWLALLEYAWSGRHSYRQVVRKGTGFADVSVRDRPWAGDRERRAPDSRHGREPAVKSEDEDAMHVDSEERAEPATKPSDAGAADKAAATPGDVPMKEPMPDSEGREPAPQMAPQSAQKPSGGPGEVAGKETPKDHSAPSCKGTGSSVHKIAPIGPPPPPKRQAQPRSGAAASLFVTSSSSSQQQRRGRPLPPGVFVSERNQVTRQEYLDKRDLPPSVRPIDHTHDSERERQEERARMRERERIHRNRDRHSMWSGRDAQYGDRRRESPARHQDDHRRYRHDSSDEDKRPQKKVRPDASAPYDRLSMILGDTKKKS
eukprot:m51a1_g676 putative splicing endonuclease positive effector (3357) ;mRNA; f:269460-283890